MPTYLKPMGIEHLSPTARERKYWSRHAEGATVHEIAEEDGCEDKIVQRVISELWARDRQHFAELKRLAKMR